MWNWSKISDGGTCSRVFACLTPEYIFRCMCLQSPLQTSPPTPQKSYPNDNVWKYPPFPLVVRRGMGGGGGLRFFFLVGILLFLWVRSQYKILESYDNFLKYPTCSPKYVTVRRQPRLGYWTAVARLRVRRRLNFPSRRWGSWLPGLRTQDPPLSPPSTWAETSGVKNSGGKIESETKIKQAGAELCQAQFKLELASAL